MSVYPSVPLRAIGQYSAPYEREHMSVDLSNFPTLEGFDPLSAEFLREPFPIIRKAQEECPVFF
jgi:hypothetical protein